MFNLFFSLYISFKQKNIYRSMKENILQSQNTYSNIQKAQNQNEGLRLKKRGGGEGRDDFFYIIQMNQEHINTLLDVQRQRQRQPPQPLACLSPPAP
jgi:hypothetical protein